MIHLLIFSISFLFSLGRLSLRICPFILDCFLLRNAFAVSHRFWIMLYSFLYFLFPLSFLQWFIGCLVTNLASLCLCFLQCLHMFLFIFIRYWTLHFLDLNECFLSHIRGFLVIIASIFSWALSLHLAVFLRWDFVSSYRTYFSAVLFGLSFCVCSLCSARLKFFFFLVSGPWSWRSWVMQSYWREGLVPAYWCMEQDLVPLVRDMPRGISRGDHGLRMTLGCLSVDGCGCVPILLVVWLEASQH